MSNNENTQDSQFYTSWSIPYDIWDGNVIRNDYASIQFEGEILAIKETKESEWQIKDKDKLMKFFLSEADRFVEIQYLKSSSVFFNQWR
jgi:hypothetical protein